MFSNFFLIMKSCVLELCENSLGNVFRIHFSFKDLLFIQVIIGTIHDHVQLSV